MQHLIHLGSGDPGGFGLDAKMVPAAAPGMEGVRLQDHTQRSGRIGQVPVCDAANGGLALVG